MKTTLLIVLWILSINLSAQKVVNYYELTTTPEQRKKDSIEKAKKDSIIKEVKSQQSITDSIENIEFMKTRAGNIYKKHPEWSKADCKDLAKGMIWIGMSLDMLKFLKGKPDHINVSDYGAGNEYQWCWDYGNPSCFYGKSNGIITSYN